MPITHLVATVCTFSSFIMSRIRWETQTCTKYSSIGQTLAEQKEMKRVKVSDLKLCLMKTIMPLNIATAASTQAAGISKLSTKMPRSFAQCAWGMEWRTLFRPGQTKADRTDHVCFLRAWADLYVVLSSQVLIFEIKLPRGKDVLLQIPYVLGFIATD